MKYCCDKAGAFRQNGNFKTFEAYIDTIQHLSKTFIPHTQADSVCLAQAFNCASTYYFGLGKYKECGQYLDKAIELMEPYSDNLLSVCFQNSGLSDIHLGKVEEGLDKINQAFNQYEVNNDIEGKFQCANLIANTMVDYRNFDMAQKYFDLALSLLVSIDNPTSSVSLKNDMGRMYNYEQKYDSALLWFSLAFKEAQQNKLRFLEGITGSNLGETYINLNRYDEALPCLDSALLIFSNYHFDMGICQEKSLLAYAHLKKGDPKQALHYQRQADALMSTIEMPPALLADYYKRTYEIAQQTGNYQDAYIHLLRYQNLQDSLNNIVKTWKVNELETRLMTSIKEKKLTQAEAQLLKEKDEKLQVLFLGTLTVSILSLLIWILLYRNKKERQLFRIKQDLLVQEHEKGTLQMQLLMAHNRLSPHLMANLFIDIRRLIEKQEKDKALKLVDNVSKVLRHCYSYAESIGVSLKDEIEFVKNYIEIRKPLLGEQFTYIINIPAEVESIKIPTLIIQLFVENAIKHGLINKEGDKRLSISAMKKGLFLSIEISDNGIGRQKAQELKTGGTGMGFVIMEKMTSHLNAQNLYPIEWIIEDLDANNTTGTVVRISIPVNYNYQQ